MVTVIDYSIRKNKDGEPFCSLMLHGGIVMVKSKETGRYYATAQKCSIPSTFDEQTCKSMIGEKIAGTVQKQSCETYEFADKGTGEIIKLNHHWVYLPEGASMEEAIFEGQPQSALV
jgi:hypothetical protein